MVIQPICLQGQLSVAEASQLIAANDRNAECAAANVVALEYAAGDVAKRAIGKSRQGLLLQLVGHKE